MVEIITFEEKLQSESMGRCLEYLLSERVPLLLLGIGKSDNPKGILRLSIKFMIGVLTKVKK